MIVKQRLRARRAMPWVVLASALAACGGKAESERQSGNQGGSPSTGGTATGGSGGSAGTATIGGTSFGGRGGTGGATGGGGGRGGSAGSAGDAGNATGGTSAGVGGGEPGGAPSGGEGGSGDCDGVDVCALRGEACCIPNVDCVSAESNCLFEVLAARTFGAYGYADLVQRIAALPQDLLVSFTLDDVDWVATDPFPSGRIELHMSAEFGAAWGAALDMADTNPFRVSCDGQPLFVGEIYMREGAAAFDSPVIHVAIDEGEPLILRLGARMPSWFPGAGPVALESRQRLDRPELRAALCVHGALRDLDP